MNNSWSTKIAVGSKFQEVNKHSFDQDNQGFVVFSFSEAF